MQIAWQDLAVAVVVGGKFADESAEAGEPRRVRARIYKFHLSCTIMALQCLRHTTRQPRPLLSPGDYHVCVCAVLAIYWKRTARRLDVSRNFPICYSLLRLLLSRLCAYWKSSSATGFKYTWAWSKLARCQKSLQLLARQFEFVGWRHSDNTFANFHAWFVDKLCLSCHEPESSKAFQKRLLPKPLKTNYFNHHRSARFCFPITQSLYNGLWVMQSFVCRTLLRQKCHFCYENNTNNISSFYKEKFCWCDWMRSSLFLTRHYIQFFELAH
jgi:hypothetical protein